MNTIEHPTHHLHGTMQAMLHKFTEIKERILFCGFSYKFKFTKWKIIIGKHDLVQRCNPMGFVLEINFSQSARLNDTIYTLF